MDGMKHSNRTGSRKRKNEMMSTDETLALMAQAMYAGNVEPLIIEGRFSALERGEIPQPVPQPAYAETQNGIEIDYFGTIRESGMPYIEPTKIDQKKVDDSNVRKVADLYTEEEETTSLKDRASELEAFVESFVGNDNFEKFFPGQTAYDLVNPYSNAA